MDADRQQRTLTIGAVAKGLVDARSLVIARYELHEFDQAVVAAQDGSGINTIVVPGVAR